MLPRDALNKDGMSFGGAWPRRSPNPRAASHHRTEALSNNLYEDGRQAFIAPANTPTRSSPSLHAVSSQRQALRPLYTQEQRRRRDATRWTLVQGILAPVQFLVFLASVVLVTRYLITGEGFEIATASIVTKTMLLYAIMITGSIWEREVFGVYLFADAFFWEDVFSFLVLALHSAYLVALFVGLDPREQMLIAAAAYASYLVNATQFVLKLRAARRDERLMSLTTGSAA